MQHRNPLTDDRRVLTAMDLQLRVPKTTTHTVQKFRPAFNLTDHKPTLLHCLLKSTLLQSLIDMLGIGAGPKSSMCSVEFQP
jgi:hypothetical protein